MAPLPPPAPPALPVLGLNAARDAFRVTGVPRSCASALRRLGWEFEADGCFWTRTSAVVAGTAGALGVAPATAPEAAEAVARALRGETVFRALTLDHADGTFQFRGETRRVHALLRAAGFRTHPLDDGRWAPWQSPRARDAAKLLATDLATEIELTDAARAALGGSPDDLLAQKPMRLRHDPRLETFAVEGDLFPHLDALRACGFRTRKRPDGGWEPWQTAEVACVEALLRSNVAPRVDVDASVHAALAAHQERVAASRRADGDARALAVPDALAYLPFQTSGIVALLGRPRALLGDDMGLGKTVQAIGVWNNDPTLQRAVVVCPQSVAINWAREWARWAVPSRRPARLVVVTANEPVPPDADVVVVNYERLIDLTLHRDPEPPPVYVPVRVGRGRYAVVREGSPPPPDAPSYPRADATAQARARTDAARWGAPLDPAAGEGGPRRRGTADAAARWRARVDKTVPAADRAAAFGVFEVVDGDAPGPRVYAEVKPAAVTTEVVPSKVLPSLLARSWDLLVVDEAHRVKRGQGKPSARSVAVLGLEAKRSLELVQRGLAQVARRALYLTGTPIPNRVVELWPLLRAIDPDRWRDFFRFGKRYCDGHVDARSGHWVFDGASNLDELQDTLRGTCMVRRTKAEVLPELPPKRRQVLVLPRSVAGPCADALDDAEAAAEAELEAAWAALRCLDGDGAAYAEAAASLARGASVHFTRMAAARRDLALRKAPYVAAHVVDLLEGGVDTVVVMAHHHGVQDLLVAQIDAALGAGTCVLHNGDLAPSVKQAAVDRFQGVPASLSPTGQAVAPDPSARVFVGSIQASGVGLTLTRSHVMVFAEVDWVPAHVSQAEDRECRIGQTHSILVQHVVVDGTLDERMVRAIVDKQDVIDRALDATARAGRVFDLAPDRLPDRVRPAARDAELPALGAPRGPRAEEETWAAGVLRAALDGAAPPGRPLTPWDRAELPLLVAGAEGGGLSESRWRQAVALAKKIRGLRPYAPTGPLRPAANATEAWAAGALVALAGNDPDRAREKNHVGFSASDGVRGHTLALALDDGQLDDDGWRAAVRLAWRYTRQCPPPDAVRAARADGGPA